MLTKQIKLFVSTQSSASTTAKYSPFATVIPLLMVEPCPPFFLCTTVTHSGLFAANSSAISAVLSVDPSSTIITSISFLILSSKNVGIPFFKNFSALYDGTTMLNILFSIIKLLYFFFSLNL